MKLSKWWKVKIMDELTFLLILAGIGVVLLVAVFTYYKHHKKIHDEIQDFNYHADNIDDVLLQNNHQNGPSFIDDSLSDDDMPGSFSASKEDAFDVDQINLDNKLPESDNFLSDDSSLLAEGSLSAEGSPSAQYTASQGTPAGKENSNDRELVDGVFINSKRVISNPNTQRNPVPSFKITTDTFNNYVNSNNSAGPGSVESSNSNKQTRPEPAELPPLADKETAQISEQKIKIVYDPIPEGVQELIISHTILKKDKYFPGRDLFNALQSAGLSFGEMNIFHYPGDDEAETFALFSVANIVEPGTFNPQDADNFSTPGISMFMRLPGRIGSNEAYDKFIQVAQIIASEINGELCDETRNQLTQQAISYKKEQIRKLIFEMDKAEKLAEINR